MISLSSLLPQIGPEPGILGMGLAHEEAREQAAAETRAACEAEFAVRLSELARFNADEMQATRRIWIDEESATLASHARQTVETAAYKLANAMEQVMTPFLARLLPQAAVAELVTKVRVAAVGDLAQAIRLVGPDDLVAATAEKLAAAGYEASAIADQQAELVAQVGDTQVVSNLGHWLSALGGEQHG